MKFILKEVDTIQRNKSSENRYRYEDESGAVVIQFHAGAKPFTFVLDIATNDLGRQFAKSFVNKWVSIGIMCVSDGQDPMTCLKTLEIDA